MHVSDDSLDPPPYDIQERTFLFAARIVKFCRALTDAHPVTRKLSWQLLDSATSVGANMEEADGGQSKPDFISKTAIAREEGKETVFWLRLIEATDPALRRPASRIPHRAPRTGSCLASLSAWRRGR